MEAGERRAEQEQSGGDADTKDELLNAVMSASYTEWRAALNAAIPRDANPIEQLRGSNAPPKAPWW